MERAATIGDNNPPADSQITTLIAADEIEFTLKTDIDRLSDEASTILATVERIPGVIANEDVYGRVVSVVARIREIANDLDNTRKSHKQPYLDAGRRIDELFKLGDAKTSLAKRLEAAIKSLSKRLSDHDTKIHREQQEQIAQERAAFAKALEADGIVMPGLGEGASLGAFTSETGGMSLREVKRSWKLIDETALPAAVLSLDPKKVQAMIDAGAHAIPGIEIHEEVVTTVKRR